jgi:hypothetical protein
MAMADGWEFPRSVDKGGRTGRRKKAKHRLVHIRAEA